MDTIEYFIDNKYSNLYIVEPNIEDHKKFKLTGFSQAYNEADIIVFLVAHKEFKNLINNNNKIELDFCGIRG